MTTHAQTVHEAAFVRIKDALAKYKFKSFRRTPMLMVQSNQLPALSVYELREVWNADGDFNTGIPRFNHRLTLGVSATVQATDDDEQMLKAHQRMAIIVPALLTDPTFMNLIDGVVSIDKKIAYSQIGQEAIAEVQCEFTVGFYTQWPQKIEDDFLVMNLKTKFGTPETPRAELEVEIPQNG